MDRDCGCPSADEETEMELLLHKRELTHGSFSGNSEVSQLLKGVLRAAPGWRRMSPVKREALEMICLKLSRAVTGDPSHEDHYIDIAGYAQLIVDSIARSRE